MSLLTTSKMNAPEFADISQNVHSLHLQATKIVLAAEPTDSARKKVLV
jgi:hypothetical protein